MDTIQPDSFVSSNNGTGASTEEDFKSLSLRLLFFFTFMVTEFFLSTQEHFKIIFASKTLLHIWSRV